IHLTNSPLYQYRVDNGYYPVIGQGNHEADIMAIGEAPGQQEAKTGVPFCGAAGKLLDEVLAETSLSRENMYITNLIKDRPPSNRDPSQEEITIYAPFLDRQIEIIAPQVIVGLGRFATEYLMKRYGDPQAITGITRMRGHTYSLTIGERRLYLIPIFHPAAAIYDSSKRSTLVEDIQTAVQTLQSHT
ncbi:MAG: uracil-DNA glycosylase, partial [Candidatus Paceibacteria bacterium]